MFVTSLSLERLAEFNEGVKITKLSGKMSGSFQKRPFINERLRLTEVNHAEHAMALCENMIFFEFLQN